MVNTDLQFLFKFKIEFNMRASTTVMDMFLCISEGLGSRVNKVVGCRHNDVDGRDRNTSSVITVLRGPSEPGDRAVPVGSNRTSGRVSAGVVGASRAQVSHSVSPGGSVPVCSCVMSTSVPPQHRRTDLLRTQTLLPLTRGCRSSHLPQVQL